MSEFTEQTVSTIETLVDTMTTMTLAENPGNTIIPIITNIPYHPGFPEDDRGKINRACAWCRDLECTDPECVEEAKDRTCLACNQVFSTDRELEEHYPCNYIAYPRYSEFCCDCCGSYFENKEQLDYHNPELCWNQQQEQEQPQIYCNCCGVSFKTQENLNEHNPDKCWADNTTYDCSCCGDHFNTPSKLLAHDRECWNEYEMSRMDQDEWDEYQDELEQERLADFREQCREEMRELRAARQSSRAEDCWDAREERDQNY